MNSTTDIARYISRIDRMHQLSRDGLATLTVRHLYDTGIIRLDQVRPVGAFVAANAHLEPEVLVERMVAEFRLAGASAGDAR